MGEDNYLDICFAVAQGTLLWQPVKFGRCSQTYPGTFDNGSGDCELEVTFKRLNGNNPATSCRNLVYFRPII